MHFGTSDPPFNPKYTHQTELEDITDAEFHSVLEVPKATVPQRIFQVISFFLFFGPLRLIVGCILFFGACFIIALIRLTCNKLGLPKTTLKLLCFKIASFGFRFLFVALGIVWTRCSGSIDKDARIFVVNHVAVCDPFILLLYIPVTPVIKYEVKYVKFLEHVLENVDPIFVERNKPHGYTNIINERAAQKDKYYPVMLFPEGTIPGGDFMLTFHRGAFCSQYKVQPACIRYHTPLVPNGLCSYQWKMFSIYEHIWQMVSMPPSFITVDFLPAMTLAEDGNGDPEVLAYKAQLAMANHLGLKASNRSSNHLYRIQNEDNEKKEAEKDEKPCEIKKEKESHNKTD